MTDPTPPNSSPPRQEALGHAVRSGLGWNLLNVLLTQVMTTVIFLTMAHHISPAVFGAFALSLVFIDAFTQQLKSASVDTLVGRQEFSKPALNAAFLTLVVICGLGFLGLWAGADWIAASVKAPQLALILPVLGSSLLMVPLTAILEAKVTADLRFRSLAVRSMVASVAGGLVGLAVALSPYSDWALVVQRLVLLGVGLATLMAMAPFIPGLSAPRDQITAFAKRALQLWSGQLMTVLPDRFGEGMVGRTFTETGLGLKSVANRVKDTLQAPLMSPLMSLWVPILSRLKHDSEARHRFYLELTRIGAVLCVPAYIGLGIIAPDLFELVFPAKYQPAAQYLQSMSYVGLIFPLSYFRTPILAALDKSRTNLVLTVIESALYLVFILIGLRGTLNFYLLITLVPMAIMGVVTAILLARLMNAKVLALVATLAPAYLATALMWGAAMALRPLIAAWPDYARIGALVLVCASVYVGTLLILFRPWTLQIIHFLRFRKQEA